MEFSTLLVIYGAGLVILLAEIFIPSGGILLVTAIGCVLFAVWEMFRAGHPVWAAVCLGGAGIYAFGLFHWAMRRVGSGADLRDATAEGADVREAAALVGREGVAVTPLRPSGVALIDARRWDVIAEGRFVEAGARVRVLAARGNRIIVQAL